MTAVTERLSTALADRYQIERRLGEGGMATVYLAADLKHKRKVALKVLKPDLAAVLGAERFVQEITTTAQLQHPHILPLFDSGTADGFLFYVMPYIEGETLRDKLSRETQLSIEESIRITTEVADALDYAHRNGVIHRDIKPENILLHDSRPMVADFGIALAVSAAAGGRMTETGLSLGTPHYMSPEQATAEKDLTARSDIYSLASVLYEMLTGNPPHTGASAQQIIMKIVTEDAAPVTTVRKSVPPNVVAAVAKALEKLPADRFDSAKAFADALTSRSFTVADPTLTAGGVGAGRLRRRVAALPWVAAAILLVIAVLGWLRPRPDALPVIRYAIEFPVDEALTAVFGPAMTLSPDGQLLVYVSTEDGGNRLRVRSRDELSSTPIPGTDGVWQPAFSPDGRRVAFVTGARALKVVSVTGEPPLTIADSGLWRNGVAWGPDGYLYIGWQRFGTVVARVSATGGEPEVLTTLDTARGEVSHAWFDALPAGRGVLFTAMRATNQAGPSDEVAVVDLRTREHKALVQGILGRYLDGYLVFVRHDGTLLAAPFDENTLKVTGPATPLLAGMPVEAGPDVALSRSGRLVYATTGAAGGLAELVWIDRSGGVRAVETDWKVTPTRAGGPALSPDGGTVAISIAGGGGNDVWIKELGGPFTKLTLDGNSVRPSWHPDGRSVVYRSVQPGLSYDLFTARADGGGGVRVLLDPEVELDGGYWSSDGTWLIASTNTGDVYGIRPATDSAMAPLLDEAFFESGPALSPNGRWLAYVSDESGFPQVYVRSFPNVNDTRRQVSTDGGLEPLWSHSGRELFYKSPTREFVAASVVADETFSVIDRRVLFAMGPDLPANDVFRSYDVSLDDQRFLTYRNVGEAQGPSAVVVVENFVEELKAKVGK